MNDAANTLIRENKKTKGGSCFFFFLFGSLR